MIIQAMIYIKAAFTVARVQSTNVVVKRKLE